MAVKRQDAWTPEDDMVLAEVTLRHIREGGTQLSAFEEVAEKLGRTPAACGFRWNSTVRKKYEAAIQIAKSQRQKRSQERGRSASLRMKSGALAGEDLAYSIENIIRFLRQYKNEVTELKRQQKQLEKELEERERQLKKLEQENMEMKDQLNHVQSDYRLVNDDYRTLVQIMERARRMALLGEENDEEGKFQSEESDNLQHVDK
ncbi:MULTISPECIES: RsfA family transcriptional regulator [Thermoactinomyces]|jgi:prespore-specific regulator|uniref:RsfA family transcriptional regulator n=1 Tax=Thermoactinomyces daqus TaxID=1329516 RepID=A0A7W1X9H5_9BACL|nr:MULTISPECIES: RsfA family transcriptional regulator [Thermoactinomyces]MBA4542560.1 RsfA family transcriptional regulator [Thermoactinomyces daqus]MBH8598040.1 RsfA family transcriptional regulator [Thermoactinomyces sp. CICC 10523]MBH8603071.1 RsfA family transcriptional regulator [Thermoactinomyces sp. CICC 10522]MBH8607122.1 RsfA family transcriptional regulator [Thermoactinomyces sp. CICC 10521]